MHAVFVSRIHGLEHMSHLHACVRLSRIGVGLGLISRGFTCASTLLCGLLGCLHVNIMVTCLIRNTSLVHGRELIPADVLI